MEWRGYLGSDGKRYKTEIDMPLGVFVASTPADAGARKAGGTLAPGDVPNAGAVGNKCHAECSNRGTCDAGTGLCACFAGYYGESCGRRLNFVDGS